MKRILLPVLFLFIAACKGPHKHRPITSGVLMTLTFVDSNTTPQVEEATRLTLQQKLDAAIPDSAEVRLTAHKLEIRIADGAMSRLKRNEGSNSLALMLNASGNFQIMELYPMSEVTGAFLKAQQRSLRLKDTGATTEGLERYHDPTLFGSLTMNNDSAQKHIGYAADTVQVDAVLQQVNMKELLPPDAQLLWERQPMNGTDYYMLWAVRQPANDCSINLTMIDTSYIQEDPYTGKKEVTFALKTRYQSNLARLTERNINRQIPVVFEHKVVNCPKVMSPIRSGKISITGAGDEQEAQYLLSVLSNRPLPARVVIVSEAVFSQ